MYHAQQFIKASKDSVRSFCHNCEGQVWLKHSLSLSDSWYLCLMSDQNCITCHVWYQICPLGSKILWEVFEISIEASLWIFDHQLDALKPTLLLLTILRWCFCWKCFNEGLEATSWSIFCLQQFHYFIISALLRNLTQVSFYQANNNIIKPVSLYHHL